MKNILTFILAFNYIATYAQDCELIAKYGIMDTRYSSVSRDRAISYLNTFKKDTHMSYQEAQSYSTSIGIPIGDVLATIGLHADENSYRQFVESLQQSESLNERYIEQIVNFEHTVNSHAIDVLKDCLTRPAIYATMINTNDPNINYIHITFKWDVSHVPVPIILTWTSSEHDIMIDNKFIKKNQLTYKIAMGQTISIALKRIKNVSIPFSLNLKTNTHGWPSNQIVPISNGNFTMFMLKKNTPKIESKQMIYVIPSQQLKRTIIAKHEGSGDEELNKIETTELDCQFDLEKTDNKIIGHLGALIVERGGDKTAFRIQQDYPIYSAPEGYKIKSLTIDETSSLTSIISVKQRSWEQEDIIHGGPLESVYWVGDTGKDHDQIDGCFIKPKLKKITVALEKL